MGDAGATSDPTQLMIRFALSKLRSRNGHHLFEDVCRHFVSSRISRHVLPATGPVAAGGDQGRDFESFRTYIDELPLSAFAAVENGQALVFACTLQVDKVSRKIKADVRQILSGEPVDLIYVFTEADVPVADRHALQGWSRLEHDVKLEIIDGNAIAEHLAKPDLYQVAVRCLGLPAQCGSAHLRHKGDGPAWSATRPDPSELPRDRPLIGRGPEIESAAAYLRASTTDLNAPIRPVIVANGPPGVGKTAFAVNVAHSVAADFPDGQYFIDTTSTHRVDDGAAGLIAMLVSHLEPDRFAVLESPESQLACLRSVFASRRIMIVLDNVTDESALREVLAVDGEVGILCTSRARFTGLAADGVRFVDIEPLAAEDAAQLAATVTDRLTEAEARALAAVCGGLPIAVLIAASRIARRPNLSVSAYLDKLANPEDGIDALSAGQRSVEAIIEHSYRDLTDEQAHYVRALGLLPNTFITTDLVWAATTNDLTELTTHVRNRVAEVMDGLFELNLLEQPAPDGYRLHDILYRFARKKAMYAGTDWQRHVIGNSCLMYGALVHLASSSIGFTDEDARIAGPGNLEALADLRRHLAGCVLMVESACDAGLWDRAVNLASVATPALNHMCRWNDLERVYACVKLAGEQADDASWTASAMHNLGIAAAHRGETDQAFDFYGKCAQVAESAGDPVLLASARQSCGNLLLNLGYPNEAIPALSGCLPAWRALRDDTMLALTLANLGKANVATARWNRAEAYLRNALQVARRARLAGLLPRLGTSLATVLRLTGRAEQAKDACQIALERARAVELREDEANALVELSLVQNDLQETESPLQALSAALELHRELGDVRNEISTLHLLGMHAKNAGRNELAVQYLDECAQLASKVDDARYVAASMAALADLYGGVGAIDDARTLIRRAEQIAVETGGDLLITQIHDHQARFLRNTGYSGGAVTLLRKSVRTLERTGQTTVLSETKTLLGEALMHQGRWQEAEPLLRSVVEAPPDIAGDRARTSALRFLATLYSRRSLWNEAREACDRALALAQKSGSASAEMHCRTTQGNILARMGEFSAAAAEYARALPSATASRDFRSIVTIRANQASCSLKSGDTDTAIAAAREGIEQARKLGLAEVEAALHLNLGTGLVKHGDLDEAMAEFTEAYREANDLDNSTLQATAALNLARGHVDRGDRAAAQAFTQEARGIFEANGEWHEAADAIAVGLLNGSSGPDDTDDRASADLSSLMKGAPIGVRTALRSMLEQPCLEPQFSGTASEDRGRSIHVADPIREELNATDVNDICTRMAHDRRHCIVCGLLIADRGRAELLLIQGADEGPDAVALAHHQCALSSVVRTAALPTDAGHVRLEIECVVWADDMPGIVVDARGPLGRGEDGRLTDVLLESLRHIGFADSRVFQRAETVIDPSRIPRLGETTLHARLVRDRVTIEAGGNAILTDASLSFLPRWYRATRGGVLVVMFGNNLQGMIGENPECFTDAVAAGNVVGACMSLRVTPPGRNSLCACTPPTNLKFKRCCGRPYGGVTGDGDRP